MVNRPALQTLGIFNSTPTIHNASQMVCIPVLNDLLRYEEIHNGWPYSAILCGVCIWVHKCAATVLQGLVVHGAPPTSLLVDELDWQKVRLLVCYKDDID